MPKKGENIRRRKDGRWEGRYMKSRGADGRAVYGYVYAKSYAEVKTAKKEAETNAEHRREPEPTPFILTDYCQGWLESVRPRVRESTYSKYHRVYTKYIEGYFRRLATQRITDKLIADYTDYLLKQGGSQGRPLSPKTVGDILLVLRQLLLYCDKKGALRYKGHMKLPRQRQSRILVFAPHEQEVLEQRLLSEENSVYMGILLDLYTGLRIGELCALRWEDVDFINRNMRVSRTVSRIQDVNRSAGAKTKVVIEKPKTRHSTRIIPLSSFLFEYLQKYRKQGSDYILTGEPFLMEPRRLFGAYKRLLNQCDLQKYNFHALRHTFATRCIESGVDIKSLSEILGHADVQITLNRYVHPSLDTKRRELEKLPFPPILEQ